MLSGIKKGKKKKKKTNANPSVVPPGAEAMREPSHTEAVAPSKKPALSGSNASAADELKKLFAKGLQPKATSSSVARKSSPSSSGALSDRLQHRLDKRLVKRQADDTVVLTGVASGAAADRPDYEPEDFRNGARQGKRRRANENNADDHDLDIMAMLKQEKESTQSMDEVYARNIARLGSRYQGAEHKVKAGASAGADEEDYIDTQLYNSRESRLTKFANANRVKSQQLAAFDRQSSVTAKSWWWMESSRFQKDMVIALGNHVTLSMAPSNLSLTVGEHFYLVPIQHADSFVSCDDQVWEEVRRFQKSLRDVFAVQKKHLLFFETVLPRQKGLWQTRLEAVVLPKNNYLDAPLYFQSTLMEQAEEWGTHSHKIIKLSHNKPVRNAIPKNFSYFFVEYGEFQEGYAQMIETDRFPRDFGIDTVAGILQVDPVRMRRKMGKQQQRDEERKAVKQFCREFQPHDWTLSLD